MHYTDSDAEPLTELRLEIPDNDSLRQFTLGYVAALLFSECPDMDAGGSFLDENYTWDDIAPESQAAILTTCRDFYQAHESDILEYGESAAGNDFLFTRNGHGCGYWEHHGTPEVCDRLDAAASSEGETYAFLDDDGLIHVS